jgi:porin
MRPGSAVARMERRRRIGNWLLLLWCSWAIPGLAAAQQAHAQATPGTSPAQAPLPGAPSAGQQPSPGPTQAPPAPAQSQGLWERDKLLGDPGGLRTRLSDVGIDLTLQETSEVLGNVTGGVNQGATYEGATLMGVSVDTEKLLGLPGGTFNASAYQIHGHGLSAENLDNLNLASGIEAPRSTRLFELWYEQSLLGGKVAVRLGQQAADQEFMLSQYAALFVNSSLGWPGLPAIDLPSGGPSYPFATPAVRLKLHPIDELTVLAGLYSGDPADNGSGTSFELDRGVFAIGEIQYAINGGDHATGLPGTYKIGAWYNSNEFPDQHFANDGLSLADPASSGVPALHRGDWSLYAIADQMVYREPGTQDQGLGVFGRIFGAPGNRNEINFELDGGVTYKGIIAGRPNDTAGLAFVYTRISDTASDLDSDVATLSGVGFPIRRNETVLELTYQAQVAPWLILQPDFQYIFNPGGSIPNPDNPSQLIGDAAVLGLVATITF